MPTPRKPDPEKYCERCGILLHRRREEAMPAFMRRRYCCLHCANQRGVRSHSSSSQHRISQKFRKKRCELCGKRKHLHVHHKDRNWKNHDPKNLETLCIACHLQVRHRRPSLPCTVCGRRARRHRMCQKHWFRFKKYGDALLTKVRKPGTPSGYSLVRVSSKR